MEASSNVDTSEWTIGRLLAWTTDYLHSHRIEEARLSAEVLLAHVLECQRIELYARFDQVPSGVHVSRFREWVRRAAEHEPIAYLVEKKEFFSLEFRVTRDVLIPRPETETLVECVIDHCKSVDLTSPSIFDLGTGSGCIAVALLTQMKGATLLATDVSAAALDVARCNAERHGVSDRMTFLEWDGPAIDDDSIPADGFDVLVSNPPYVAKDAMDKLDTNVRDYEPQVALTDGADGLCFYRAMAGEAGRLLREKGVVFVEIEDDHAVPVVEVMEAATTLKHVHTWKDRVVGKDRVLQFSRTASDGCTE